MFLQSHTTSTLSGPNGLLSAYFSNTISASFSRYGLRDCGSISSKGKIFLLWGPPGLFSNGYRRLFTRDKAGGAWSWTFPSIQFWD